MARLQTEPPIGAESRSRKAGIRLPDPKSQGPFRPFATDPGWDEAWWWLGSRGGVGDRRVSERAGLVPALRHPGGVRNSRSLSLRHSAARLVDCRRLALSALRQGPGLVFTVALIGGLSCLYIAGEKISWGQHFFHWDTPEYWAMVNRQEETNLHNTYAIFEKTPRSILEAAIFVGGLLVPLAALFWPWLRACRVSIFLPPAALVPTALGAMIFKLIDRLQQGSTIPTLLFRPSETVETYLYFFIFAYLLVFARRIKELEVAEGVLR